jgi:hypothetical protein
MKIFHVLLFLPSMKRDSTIFPVLLPFLLPYFQISSNNAGIAQANISFLFLLLWRYSPNWALDFSILHFQASLFLGDLFQFLHFNIPLASLSTASHHLPLGLPTDPLPSRYPFGAFWGTPSFFILVI